MVAYIDADDQDHQSAADILQTHSGPIYVPQLVVTEVAYLVNTRLGVGPEVLFLQDLASGNFDVTPVDPSDWRRIAELVDQYDNLTADSEPDEEGNRRGHGLGTVDASVVATAERLNIYEVATLDNDFRIVVPAHAHYFTVLP